MRFCEYCGAPLEDGQLCTCPQAQQKQQEPPTTQPESAPVEQTPPQQPATPPEEQGYSYGQPQGDQTTPEEQQPELTPSRIAMGINSSPLGTAINSPDRSSSPVMAISSSPADMATSPRAGRASRGARTPSSSPRWADRCGTPPSTRPRA